MSEQYKKVIDIYHNVLLKANYFREQAKKEQLLKTRKSRELEQKYEDIAHELYKVAAELEQTREVNSLEK